MSTKERLAALLADPELAESPLASLCRDMLAEQKRFDLRLERISRIADGYQSDLRQTNHALIASNERLTTAFNDIRTLRGFIPICSKCKKVRDDGGYWDDVESYLGKHADVVLGSSVCPGCSSAEGSGASATAPILVSNEDEADAEQKRLEAILADDVNREHPLRGEYERLSLRFQKLIRRLNKISHISDGFQSQLKELNMVLAKVSRTDTLTLLANRRPMLERLDMETYGVDGEHPPFALAMIDIDHFKRINDSFGHAVGDSLLCALADTLRATMRDSDFAARWGGEEFLLLITNADRGMALAFCDRLRIAVEAMRVEHNSKGIGCTISIGIAMHKPVVSYEDTIRDADRALYAAKSYGRNTVVCAEDI